MRNIHLKMSIVYNIQALFTGSIRQTTAGVRERTHSADDDPMEHQPSLAYGSETTPKTAQYKSEKTSARLFEASTTRIAPRIPGDGEAIRPPDATLDRTRAMPE